MKRSRPIRPTSISRWSNTVPSRALNTTRYTYVWNGWADGETEQPRTMGSEVTALLRKNANKAEDSAYPDYAERA
jgi:hypothetical protein